MVIEAHDHSKICDSSWYDMKGVTQKSARIIRRSGSRDKRTAEILLLRYRQYFVEDVEECLECSFQVTSSGQHSGEPV